MAEGGQGGRRWPKAAEAAGRYILSEKLEYYSIQVYSRGGPLARALGVNDP